jgi:UDP-GlcNAc:undecaprenyl-phosphate/decaprenyl-phosphate GlcNAc-1-phosphate transferase
MLTAGLILFFAAMATSLLITWLAKRMAARLGLMDEPGHRKVHTQVTPRNGGIGIFWGIAAPILAGVLAVTYLAGHATSIAGIAVSPRILEYIPGMVRQRPLLLLLLLTTFLTHLLGLLDDRKAMAPIPKLLGQLAIATMLVLGGEWIERGGFRLPMVFGEYLGPGFYISTILSILWIVALTNAFNFLDNMDGLSAGVAFICAGMFLIAAGSNGQWFISALLLLFMGAVLGFLCYNFPPASIFMGDGGSMVLGFFLSALTLRTTYYHTAQHWYAMLMPLVILAVPLYDLVVVSVIRMLRGKSPMVGDTNHFSHRLTRHGFSKRGAVLVIYAVTLACGISAPLLATATESQAILIVIQCMAMLTVIGILERVGEHTSDSHRHRHHDAPGDRS